MVVGVSMSPIIGAHMAAFFERFWLKTTAIRQVLTLASGTAAAQAVTIIAAPLMTRLYRVEDYGVLALFGVVVGMAALVASGKYEPAILIPKEDATAAAIAGVCLLITVVTAAALTVALWFTCHPLAAWLGDPLLAPWLQLVPLAIMLTNLGMVMGVWANRQQAYGALAKSRLAGALAGTAANIALGFAGWGADGLVCGFLVVQVVTLAVLRRPSSDLFRTLKSKTNFRAIREAAGRFANFPKFSLGAELLNCLSSQLIVVLIPKFFGMAVLGWYAMGQRVIGIPSSLVGGAVGEVFRSQASRDYAERGNCSEIFSKTLKHLALLGAGPFLLLMVAAPDIFAWVFGESWRMAGRFTQVMSVMFLLRFVVSPLTHTFMLAGRQQEDLWLHFYITLSSAAALGLGYWLSEDAVITLLCFSLNFGSIYLYYLWRSHRFAQGPAR